MSTRHWNVLAWSDYLKLVNLPVQENGTTPTMHGEEVTGGGGGVPSPTGGGDMAGDQAPYSATTGYMPGRAAIVL